MTWRDLKTGIDRTRRFASLQADRAYDLVNCYVNESGRIVKRPGFTGNALPAACRGLYGWRGQLHTFAAVPTANPNPALYVINVLRHPTGGAAALSKIYNVVLAQGGLYVSARFTDNVIRHYWLQPVDPWSANKDLSIGDLVTPTAPVGFFYKVLANTTIKTWKPDTNTALNDRVQPTGGNGFYYKATTVTGTDPQTGSFEPEWPTASGGLITEVHLVGPPKIGPGATDTTGPQDPPEPPDRPNPSTRDRYPPSGTL